MRFAAALPHARAFVKRSADGVTVTASASGEWSEFIPILPADVEAMLGQPARRSLGEVGSVTVFRSLGSKTDCGSPEPRSKAAPVLHVRFPAPWSVVAENRRISNWRRLLTLVRTAVLGDE